MNMKLSEIVISSAFSENPPAARKLKKCREFFAENGKLDRDIVVSHDGILIDGYVGYLVLLENGVERADVQVSEVSLYQRSRSYQNIETVYVFGRHAGKQREYVWRVTSGTKNVDQLHVGGNVMVKTKYGNKVVTVTNIRTLTESPVKGTVKKVLKCLSD